MEKYNLSRGIDRPTKYLNRRPLSLLRPQPMPCHHRLLQRVAINQLASTVIQRRGLRGIDIDFVVVVGQSLSPLFLSRQLQPLPSKLRSPPAGEADGKRQT